MSEDIIYGKNPIIEAIEAGTTITKVVFAEGLHADNQMNKLYDLLKRNRIPFSKAPRSKVDQIAGTPKNQGIVAYMSTYSYYGLKEILKKAKDSNEDPFILLLDGVKDPHNLGAIIRTAESAGVHGIVIPKRNSCPVNSTVYKTSAGAINNMMIYQCSNINQTIKDLKKENIWVAGLEGGHGQVHSKTDLTGPIAVVMGSEGEGISKLTKESCDFLLQIPMKGQVNSLNVSVATAVIIYEIVRQRG